MTASPSRVTQTSTTATIPEPAERVAKLYRPRGAAKALFPCRDTEILIEGPAGTGKTIAALEKVNRWLIKCPGARALGVRKTRASMTESVLVTYESKVVPCNPDYYPDTSTVLRRIRQSYDYPNGSSFVIGGMDNADRIMSTEFDIIVAFEATELIEGEWEQLLSRLRNGVMPFQQAIADCNPGPPQHWLNQRANAGKMTRLLSRHRDNPRMWDESRGEWTPAGRDYLGILTRSLSGSRYLRLLEGRWAASEGVVYEAFDAAVHVIDPFDVPADWRRIRSIDFGLRNPFVAQWWALDNDGRMYLYREIYMTGRMPGEHAKQIAALSEGERIEATVSDHDLDDRDALARAGIDTRPAYKAVVPGIEAVAARLKVERDGKPRLMLMRGCRVEMDHSLVAAKLPTATEEEFDGYVYVEGVDGKPRKEEPKKLNDHGLDAARYAVAYVDDLASNRVEIVSAPFEAFA